MKGIFWNSRGLKDLAKRRFLAEASIEHRLDFIALSETGRDNFSPQFLNTLSGGIDFDWHCLPPRGRSVGSYSELDPIRSKSELWSWEILRLSLGCGRRLMGLIGLWWRYMVPHSPNSNLISWLIWLGFVALSIFQSWWG